MARCETNKQSKERQIDNLKKYDFLGGSIFGGIVLAGHQENYSIPVRFHKTLQSRKLLALAHSALHAAFIRPAIRAFCVSWILSLFARSKDMLETFVGRQKEGATFVISAQMLRMAPAAFDTLAQGWLDDGGPGFNVVGVPFRSVVDGEFLITRVTVIRTRDV